MLTLLASLLSPFFVDVCPEVRSTYVSIGQLLEDRPMQTTFIRAGWDTGKFGRFSVRNFDVSSLTGRRQDVHSRALYHMEVGPAWQYDWKFTDGWTLKSELTHNWTFYRSFRSSMSNQTYFWWQLDQSLENPYLVPFYAVRKAYKTSDYLYCKLGVRRRCPLGEDWSLTPSVQLEGGDDHNQIRVFGTNKKGDGVGPGFYTITFRLQASYRINDWCSVFAAVEQYEVMGPTARSVNDANGRRCAHNDWTIGTIGAFLHF